MLKPARDVGLLPPCSIDLPMSIRLLLSLYRQLVQKVKVWLEAAEEMAKTLLSNHRTQLEALASRAAERKVLDGDEVRSVISAGSTAASENPKNRAP